MIITKIYPNETTLYAWGNLFNFSCGCHSSVVSSALTTMARVWIPSTPSKLQFVLMILYLKLEWEKSKKKLKRGCDWHLLKNFFNFLIPPPQHSVHVERFCHWKFMLVECFKKGSKGHRMKCNKHMMTKIRKLTHFI